MNEMSMNQQSTRSNEMNEKENQSLSSLTLRDYFNVLWGHLAFAFHYVARDTKKRILGFFIGLITIIIVVFVVSILYNSILKASIVFVKLAENQASEVDFVSVTLVVVFFLSAKVILVDHFYCDG